ncbi:hypothetical protein HPB49_006613 [Dermacentor silvarum]|uniref:Uncharacterized protein n=2 Tax=Dermacentor silvarum TaxID=543639 RepID=A0ACB8CQC8_DERSI|nr:hypothetical protein HPB49_006613 [Dermacentor silvarum]
MAHLVQAVRSNSVLRKLEIDLAGFGVDECCEFFDAVADNATLVSVAVRRLPNDVQVDGICKKIRERGIQDRVRICHHHLSWLDIATLRDCPEITSVIVSGWHFAEDMGYCRDMFHTLVACPHVTSVRVDTWYFCDYTFMMLTDYVTRAQTLTELEINVTGIPEWRSDEDHLSIERSLVKAVSFNASLVAVNITGILLYNKHCVMLADAAAARSRRLTHLRITPANTMNPTFANLMPQLLAWYPRHVQVEYYNYKNRGHAYLREITARNNRNVLAAVRYVLGNWNCDDGARVLEAIHNHPSLVYHVRRKTEVGTVDANAKIAHALKRIRSCGIDEYMRLAGVVKRRVMCIKHESGVGMQIADLNEYCWLYIRRYLKIADVVGV